MGGVNMQNFIFGFQFGLGLIASVLVGFCIVAIIGAIGKALALVAKAAILPPSVKQP